MPERPIWLTSRIRKREGNSMGKGGGGQQQPQAMYTNDPRAIQQANQLRDAQFQQSILESNRGRALEQGRQMGNEIFGTGTLPRVQQGRAQEQADFLANRRAISQVAGQRSGQMQDVLAQREAGLGGYTSPEYGAMRQKAYEGFQNQMQTGLRGLARAQGNNRVSGAAAAAQNARFQQSGAASAAQAERDLMLQNINERQNRLGQYEQSLTGAEGTEWNRLQQALQGEEGTMNQIRGDELGREQFNIGQLQREKAGQLQSMLGMAGLSAGDWASGVRSAIAGNQMQSAMAPGGGGGKGGGK